MESINTEGLTEVGEVTTRVMREAVQEPDFQHAHRAGATAALNEALLWVRDRLREAGPYDDVRALGDMVTWISDKIREVNSPPTTNGNSSARHG